MFTVPENFHSKGAAWKAVFVLDQLERMEMARAKDVLAVVPDRDTAEELRQNIIDEIDVYNHNQTGTMENSIGIRKMGDEYGVTGIHYAKYVNSNDRLNEGEGFIDSAANQTMLDTGEEVIVLV